METRRPRWSWPALLELVLCVCAAWGLVLALVVLAMDAMAP